MVQDRLEVSGKFTMIIGIPKEIKPDEYRVAILPAGVEDLVRAGHHVLVESGAGLGSGISDAQFAEAGAQIVPVVAARSMKRRRWSSRLKNRSLRSFAGFGLAKSYLAFPLRRGQESCSSNSLPPGQLLWLTRPSRMPADRLPLLAPMSEVAGRMSIQQGAKYLERPKEGAGCSWAVSPAWAQPRC